MRCHITVSVPAGILPLPDTQTAIICRRRSSRFRSRATGQAEWTETLRANVQPVWRLFASTVTLVMPTPFSTALRLPPRLVDSRCRLHIGRYRSRPQAYDPQIPDRSGRSEARIDPRLRGPVSQSHVRAKQYRPNKLGFPRFACRNIESANPRADAVRRVFLPGSPQRLSTSVSAGRSTEASAAIGRWSPIV